MNTLNNKQIKKKKTYSRVLMPENMKTRGRGGGFTGAGVTTVSLTGTDSLTDTDGWISSESDRGRVADDKTLPEIDG